MNVQEITITKAGTVKGSNMTRWNFDVDGVAFGQVWTFTAYGETHRFHAKTLAGDYANFSTFSAAEVFMRDHM